MKTVKEENIVEVSILNNVTGELSPMPARHIVTNNYYSIKKLRQRSTMEDISRVQSEICSTKRDIELFWYVLKLANNNQLVISQKEVAEEFKMSKVTMSRFMKRMVDSKLLKKVSAGNYIVNPYMIKTRGSTNDVIELMQKEWE